MGIRETEYIYVLTPRLHAGESRLVFNSTRPDTDRHATYQQTQLYAAYRDLGWLLEQVRLRLLRHTISCCESNIHTYDTHTDTYTHTHTHMTSTNISNVFWYCIAICSWNRDSRVTCIWFVGACVCICMCVWICVVLLVCVCFMLYLYVCVCVRVLWMCDLICVYVSLTEVVFGFSLWFLYYCMGRVGKTDWLTDCWVFCGVNFHTEYSDSHLFILAKQRPYIRRTTTAQTLLEYIIATYSPRSNDYIPPSAAQPQFHQTLFNTHTHTHSHRHHLHTVHSISSEYRCFA